MALIGRNTVTGNFIKCSNLTPDGSTTTFTLTNSTTGDNVYPGNQNSLIVSVSGVIQNPGTAYTINNNQIIFSTAPSISDTIDFIVILGDLVAIGTPSNDTVDTVHIKDGAVHNVKLQNSAITINGTSISLGASGTIVAGTDWQAVITADGSTATTASAGEGYFIDTTSNAHTVTLPSSPTQGDEVTIVDYAGTFGINNVTVGRNGSNIDGTAIDGTLATNRLNVRFVYIDATQGWKAVFDDASASYGASFITATGGTVTTSGDYKIHTFTGDGCFVVSSVGNPGGSDTVDYLVVAGGGGSGTQISGNGGVGGGGAGGYRESSGAASGCYTRSPLGACVSALPVSVTTYPVTVGAGGAGVPSSPPGCRGNPGSNSVFSTITSTGGGGSGASIPSGVEPGLSGGSGGGAAQTGGGYPKTGGSGNTPPTSPPQGNDGGDTTVGAPNYSGSGGGGATAAGAGNTSTAGGNGGAGATTSISGTPTAYAGGGGGGVYQAGTPGNGGAGGGGDAGAPNQNDAGDAGGTNTGGGAGGASSAGNGTPVAGSAGGSGIVIIRYKYQ